MINHPNRNQKYYPPGVKTDDDKRRFDLNQRQAVIAAQKAGLRVEKRGVCFDLFKPMGTILTAEQVIAICAEQQGK